MSALSPEMRQLSPNLMVTDVRESVEYYEDVLGFDLQMAVPETEDAVLTELPPDEHVVYAVVARDGVQVMLQSETSLEADVPAFGDRAIGGSVCLYVEMDGVEAYFEEIAADVDVVQEPSTTWYGMEECYVRDLDGYVLGFAEQREQP